MSTQLHALRTRQHPVGHTWTHISPVPIHTTHHNDTLSFYLDPYGPQPTCCFCFQRITLAKFTADPTYYTTQQTSSWMGWRAEPFPPQYEYTIHHVTHVSFHPCGHEIPNYHPEWYKRYTWPNAPTEPWPPAPEHWGTFRLP